MTQTHQTIMHFLSLIYFQYFPLKPCEELDLLRILFSFKYEVLKHMFIRLTKDPWGKLMITFAMEPFLCCISDAVSFFTFRPSPLAHLWLLLFSSVLCKENTSVVCASDLVPSSHDTAIATLICRVKVISQRGYLLTFQKYLP